MLRKSAVNSAALSVLFLTLVALNLVFALLTKDFRFAYVAQYCSQLLPWHYGLSALWVGQAGSLLLWAWFLGLLAMLFRRLSPRRGDPLREATFGLLMAFYCFLIATMVFAADPMAGSIGTPREGAGLSPLLQHPAMLIHPPIVFLGYAAWTIPCALALAALGRGHLDTQWVHQARPWAIFAWAVLGAGILLGAEWAYEELGWGGYWGWDPVENGSLIPWLTGTAFMHTLMTWRQRGLLKKTAVGLAIATFAMCNFATFLTRSGIFSSLHAFSQSPIGWLFLALMVVLTLAGGFLVLFRRAELAPDKPISAVFSREAMVVASTVALLLLAVVTCLGTVSVALSDALVGHKIIVGPPFYNNVLAPTGLLVLLATALAPMLRWGSAPRAAERRVLLLSAVVGSLTLAGAVAWGVKNFVSLAVTGIVGFAVIALVGSLFLDAKRRYPNNYGSSLPRCLREKRRQYAGFLVHLGFFGLAIGVVGSSVGARRHEIELEEGQTKEWAGRTIRLVEVIDRKLPDKLIAEAKLEVSRKGDDPYTLFPAQHLHRLQNEWTTEVAIESDWGGDFYVILHGSAEVGRASLTLVENPMMRWLWLGGATMLLGAVISLWPKLRRAKENHSLQPPTRDALNDFPDLIQSTKRIANRPTENPPHLPKRKQPPDID
ncbi:cytochrome c-type biogenesis CcmF C-terminal domain-containing protein, partial [Pirellulales bacterium]|nr:cytochrome c-type biogenesis CcmF C-terminal domain-containing protein [Pirellulales bacterium]